MSIQNYPNGIGASVGDSLATCRPLQTTGNVWYVNSVGGVDAASPAGQNREKPLASSAQALTNAVSGDIIVYLSTHAETLTSQLAVSKTLTFVGEGSSGGKPTVRLTMNAAGQPTFVVTQTACEFRNIYFPTNLQTNSQAKIKVSAGGGTLCKIRGCYFECGATDAFAVDVGGDQCRIESSTFISVATLLSAQPLLAITSTASGTVSDLELNNVVVSAGTVGFSNYAAIDLTTGGGTFVRLKIENLNLLLGADVTLGAASTGRVNVQLATGGSRVQWG